MAVLATGRAARTHVEQMARFDVCDVARITLQTGRTHQIRVHLAHIGCPVLCDRLYGGRSQITRGEICGEPDDRRVVLSRHALHARRLSLKHPMSNEAIDFEAPLPNDLAETLDELRRRRSAEPK